MPVLYRLILFVLIGLIGFFWFRFLMRTGVARRAFEMQERDANVPKLNKAARRALQDVEDRKAALRRQQAEISKELKQK